KSRNAFFVAEYGATDAKAADRGRRNWSIRRQFHTGLLSDVVPKLSRDRASYGMAEGRYFCSDAVHGGFRRCAVGRLAIGSFAEANRQCEPGTQTADSRRLAAGVDDRRRELCRQQRGCDRYHVGCILRSGCGESWLDPHYGCGSKATGWS